MTETSPSAAPPQHRLRPLALTLAAALLLGCEPAPPPPPLPVERVRFAGHVSAADPEELEVVLTPAEPGPPPAPLRRRAERGGSFDFGQIPRGRWTVRVLWNGQPLGVYAIQGAHGCRDFHGDGVEEEIDLGAARPADWRVYVGVQVRGRVVDAWTERPVAGASLGFDPRATADAQGRFAVWFPSGGSGARLVRASGYAPRPLWLGAVRRPLGREVEVRLEPGLRLEGVVRGADGEPLSGVWIGAHQDDLSSCPLLDGTDRRDCWDSGLHQAVTRSRAGGRFVLDGLEAGGGVARLSIHALELRPAPRRSWSGHAVAGPGMPPLEIVLR